MAVAHEVGGQTLWGYMVDTRAGDRDPNERMAAAEAWAFRPYRSKQIEQGDTRTWIQIDLGESVALNAIRLYPAARHLIAGDGFPTRFRLEAADDPGFTVPDVIVDCSTADFPDPNNNIVSFDAGARRARFVRLFIVRVSPKKVPTDFLQFYSEEQRQKISEAPGYVSLAKIEVLSPCGVDLAVGRPVTVDSTLGNSEDAVQLTRPRRPMGEGILTDKPSNVTSQRSWRPAAYQAWAPPSGVSVHGTLFATAMRTNISYLLDSFSVDDILRPFRVRAGVAVAKPDRAPSPFWDDLLSGSSAGRFLMGAANTLRWMEDAELRGRMNCVIDGIASCRQANGYIMAYPEDTFFKSERGGYTRAWVTHGLIDAGRCGSGEALSLLRGYYDWYNRHPKKAEMLRGCIQGGQGMVANTRLYFTSVGMAEDIQVIQRYFQENYWLEELRAGNVDAIWQYPYDRPHSYLITNLEAYLDLYRATGDRKYYDAVVRAWKLFRDNWQTVGGSLSIIEVARNIPKSNPLYERLGETCGSAFWILLNQRLHSLDPSQECYIAEIERTIYNVILANQASGSRGIRYYTKLVGRKSAPGCVNSCCEGQGARIIGSLPELIFSISNDGLYLNLFSSSCLRWEHRGTPISVAVYTEFPHDPRVAIVVSPARAVRSKLYLRVPSWASSQMDIRVNGKPVLTGDPGTYAILDRLWKPGDQVDFRLPMKFKLKKYEGIDRIAGRDRFSLEYGSILMSALELADDRIVLLPGTTPEQMCEQLRATPDKTLQFTVETAQGRVRFVPYYEIDEECFSCVPIIETQSPIF